jgi:D-arabinose 1-dehydrogenase-like Zn-dependent alcohol dehydrogenase
MKSYRIAEFGKPLRCEETTVPEPAGAEVLLQVRAAGVCHTDLHVWHGGYDLGGGKFLKMSERGVHLPHTMGHETVGVVVAAGPTAQGVKIGETMLVYPWIGCGECAHCKSGDENLCLAAPRYLGIFRAGGYSTHIVVPDARYLVPIGDLDPVQAAPYACAGLTAFSAIKKLGKIVHDGPIVLIGAGGLGLMALSLLEAVGAKGAVVVDIDETKRAAARDAGAIATIDPRDEKAAEKISAAIGGAARAVIDFVGAPPTVKLGASILGKGGVCVLVGLVGGEVTLSIPPFPLRAISLSGSFVGNLAELHELMALVREGRVKAIPIVQTSLDKVNSALEELEAGRLVGRAILVP